jgi:hypothetical protein
MLKNQKQDTIKIEPSIVNCFNRPSFIIRSIKMFIDRKKLFNK